RGEDPVDGLARSDSDDPALPDRDDGGMGIVDAARGGSIEGRDLRLSGTPPESAGHRHDLGGVLDDQALGDARKLAGESGIRLRPASARGRVATAADDPERQRRSAQTRRAAASRSSSAWSGEKSRRRRNWAAAARRS